MISRVGKIGKNLTRYSEKFTRFLENCLNHLEKGKRKKEGKNKKQFLIFMNGHFAELLVDYPNLLVILERVIQRNQLFIKHGYQNTNRNDGPCCIV